MKQIITHRSEIFTLLVTFISPILGPERRNGMSTPNKYQTKLVGIALAVVASIASVGVAHAQSGHFVGTPTCRDQGTTLQCSGKVAGLGSTTFQIDVAAQGTASVVCTNPGGNVAPGQSFTTTTTGTGGPFPTPRNGSARFTVNTVTPSAPPGSCPNEKWTATVTDVEFGDATITLREDSTVSDTITVPVD